MATRSNVGAVRKVLGAPASDLGAPHAPQMVSKHAAPGAPLGPSQARTRRTHRRQLEGAPMTKGEGACARADQSDRNREEGARSKKVALKSRKAMTTFMRTFEAHFRRKGGGERDLIFVGNRFLRMAHQSAEDSNRPYPPPALLCFARNVHSPKTTLRANSRAGAPMTKVESFCPRRRTGQPFLSPAQTHTKDHKREKKRKR